MRTKGGVAMVLVATELEMTKLPDWNCSNEDKTRKKMTMLLWSVFMWQLYYEKSKSR